MNKKIKTFFLPALLIFIIVTRLPLIIEGTIPFMFDHGRDSVEVLNMIMTKTPRLIGPRASIPGLFFGPAWYYLIAPTFVFGNFYPTAPVVLMLLLNIIEVWLVYKYFGKMAALIAACGVSWLGLATSAWNPSVMPLIILGILIIIQQQTQKQTAIRWFILSLLVSISFHFSSAFGVTLLVSVPLIFIQRKFRLSRHDVLIILSGFLIPFTPQLLFEMRHSFIETNAIFSYFKAPNGEREINFIRPLLGLFDQWSRMMLVIPWLSNLQSQLLAVFGMIVLLLTARKKTTLLNDQLIRDVFYLLMPAYLLFSLTHFSSWYWYGTLPLCAIVLTKLLRSIPLPMRKFFLGIIFISPILNLIFFYQSNKQSLDNNPNFLVAKMKAINWIYAHSNNQPFAVYHFLPDVYDYAYQYLWMEQSLHGKRLPTDFSYRPNESTYIPEKQEILEKLPNRSNQAPTYIFYIVEVPFYKNYLQDWWGQQHYSQVLDQTEIVPGLIVYQAIP